MDRDLNLIRKPRYYLRLLSREKKPSPHFCFALCRARKMTQFTSWHFADYILIFTPKLRTPFHLFPMDHLFHVRQAIFCVNNGLISTGKTTKAFVLSISPLARDHQIVQSSFCPRCLCWLAALYFTIYKVNYFFFEIFHQKFFGYPLTHKTLMK